MNFLKELGEDQGIIDTIKESDKSNSIESSLVNILKEIISIRALMIKGRILRVLEKIIEKEIEEADFDINVFNLESISLNISFKNHFDTLVSYKKIKKN